MDYQERVNRVFKKLSAEEKEKFYEEFSRQKAKGLADESAIGEAFKKVGIEDIFAVKFEDD